MTIKTLDLSTYFIKMINQATRFSVKILNSQ